MLQFVHEEIRMDMNIYKFKGEAISRESLRKLIITVAFSQGDSVTMRYEIKLDFHWMYILVIHKISIHNRNQ